MRRVGLVAIILAPLAACGTVAPGSVESAPITRSAATSTTLPAETASAPSTSSTSSPAVPTPSRTSSSSRPAPTDPRNVFYASDRHRYRSAWFDGAWPIMVPYGCTKAPYYRADARCRGGQGFHHGIDIAMACRVVLRAGVAGTVVSPASAGAPGAAYGAKAFRIRTRDGRDVLVAHAATVYVRPGDRVKVGQKIALAGDLGAPDGCHLHLEVRRAGGGVSTAVDPAAVLGLRR